MFARNLSSRLLRSYSLINNDSLAAQLVPQLSRSCSTGGSSTKTTVNILNQEEDAALMVDSYSTIGFRLNNKMSVIGPIAIFPKSVLSWNVESAESVTKESLSLFTLIEPRIDLLVIGVGDRGNKISPEVIQYMRSKKITMEILPTEQACATFNFLNSEKRQVAAAIIPPRFVKFGDDDVTSASFTRKMILEDEY